MSNCIVSEVPLRCKMHIFLLSEVKKAHQTEGILSFSSRWLMNDDLLIVMIPSVTNEQTNAVLHVTETLTLASVAAHSL